MTKRYPSLACTAPAFLKKGDRIALVSPSYFTPMENVTGAAEVLRGWGFEPVVGPHVGRIVSGQYAGTPAERAEDLRWALEDPSVKAILCNRGGYGTLQLLDLLSPETFAAHPKWLIGYSDITTLLEMEACAGVMGIHGAMCSHIAPAQGRDRSSLLLRDLLLGDVPAYTLPSHPLNRLGKASGTLIGGNLSTVVPLLDTWADATRRRDIILFIEEVEESMHHIDRLLRILQRYGVFDRCRALVLGEFTGCGNEFDYDSVEAMVLDILKEYDFPILCGFPAGHGEENLPLMMGAPVSVDIRDEGAALTFII